MMRVPMVPSQSLHGGYVNDARSVRSSGCEGHGRYKGLFRDRILVALDAYYMGKGIE